MPNYNIQFVEPNMAMFLYNHEFKFYNLIYNLGQTTSKQIGYENYLLVRLADGSIPQTSYPTTIEVQTPIYSLDYDGVYFWSVQAINDTPEYPGTIIRRWEIDLSQYGLTCTQFKTIAGFETLTALTIEYYYFTIYQGTDPSRNFIIVSTSFSYIINRLRIGQYVRLGPNVHGNYFWGKLAEIRGPFFHGYELIFTENVNATYVSEEQAFVETRLFTTSNSGYLSEWDPATITLLHQRFHPMFKTVSSLSYSTFNHIININLGNRTGILAFVVGMNVFFMQVNTCMMEETPFIACKALPLHYTTANEFINIAELRIRNDDPDSLSNHPQLYFLQKEYRDEAGIQNLSSYNYVTVMVEAAPAFMVTSIQPEFMTPNVIIDCSCQILDDFMLPVSDIAVNWSASNDAGQFITTTGTTTNANGMVYATFSGASNVVFPTSITTTAPAVNLYL